MTVRVVTENHRSNLHVLENLTNKNQDEIVNTLSFFRATGYSWIPLDAVLKEPHKNVSTNFSGKDGIVTSLPLLFCKLSSRKVREAHFCI